MKNKRQVQSERRILDALERPFDTGNALTDAWEELMLVEDAHEFEFALLGKPKIDETVDGNDTIFIVKDTAYYLDRLRRLYVEKASEELAAHHPQTCGRD